MFLECSIPGTENKNQFPLKECGFDRPVCERGEIPGIPLYSQPGSKFALRIPLCYQNEVMTCLE